MLTAERFVLGKVCGLRVPILSRRGVPWGDAGQYLHSTRSPAVADLNAELAPQVIAACTANAEEMAGALGRAFEGDFVVKPGESAAFDLAAIEGTGLAVLMPFGDAAVLALLPQSSGLLPDWASAPDPTGQSQLSTLGQELSMLVVPDDLMADDFQVEWSEDLAAAVARAEPGEGAVTVPIELAQGETLGVMHLVWPLTKIKAFAAPAEETNEGADETAEPVATEKATAETPSEAPTSAPSEAPTSAPSEAPTSTVLRWENSPSDYSDLPPNVMNLLKVTTPVSVNLASKTVPINEIIELGPGSIITFDKSCDDLLEIMVGDCPIAEGEAVKVGERFGVRIRQMILPQEDFRPMLPPQAG